MIYSIIYSIMKILIVIIECNYCIEFEFEQVMILMELCKHGTLRDVLKYNLPWNLLVRLALDIAQGLDFMHGQNIIHRYGMHPNIKSNLIFFIFFYCIRNSIGIFKYFDQYYNFD